MNVDLEQWFLNWGGRHLLWHERFAKGREHMAATWCWKTG